MEWLESIVLTKPLWMWGVFLTIVGGLLYFDLGVLHRRAHAIGVKESLALSGFYIFCGMLFSVFIGWQLGSDAALKYITGFVIEESLSMDNIFVMALILGYFAIPRENQHRVLFWGIMGVIILRGIMIGVGAELVERFHWILYLFAVFLLVTGVKMLWAADKPHVDIADNPVLKFLRSHIRVTHKLHDNHFFVRMLDPKTDRLAWFATPLFLALVLIELSDVVFAVDSVPAIFAITTDPYIVYTSNIFAIMGLRALYFALSAMLDRFAYLKYALALVLVFIGGKMLAIGIFDLQEFPPMLSLGITLAILGSGFAFSLYKTRSKAPE